jgi:hypothetical protein
MFKMVRGPETVVTQTKMPTRERRILLLLAATRDLPVDIQREILRHYPPPERSPRIQGFVSRWKAARQ